MNPRSRSSSSSNMLVYKPNLRIPPATACLQTNPRIAPAIFPKYDIASAASTSTLSWTIYNKYCKHNFTVVCHLFASAWQRRQQKQQFSQVTISIIRYIRWTSYCNNLIVLICAVRYCKRWYCKRTASATLFTKTTYDEARKYKLARLQQQQQQQLASKLLSVSSPNHQRDTRGAPYAKTTKTR